MRIHAVLAVLGALTFGVSTANAATSLTATFDPTTGLNSGGSVYSSGTFAVDAPQTIGVGDEFSLNYSFGGQGITGDFTGVTVSAGTSGPDQLLWVTGTVSFLGSLGEVLFSTSSTTDTSNLDYALGYKNIGTQLINWPGFVTFSSLSTTIYGILFSGTIVDIGYGADQDRNYTAGSFQLFGSGISTVAAVPVPAALPLLAVGLGALGFMGWRKKRAAAPLAA